MSRLIKGMVAFFLVCVTLTVLLVGYLFYSHNHPSDDFVPYDRPPLIPEESIWAGGPDGGAWIRVVTEEVSQDGVIEAVVYGDHSGDIWYEGRLKISNFKRSDIEIDLTKEGSFKGWDGEKLFLRDGRYFTPMDSFSIN